MTLQGDSYFVLKGTLHKTRWTEKLQTYKRITFMAFSLHLYIGLF